MVNVGDKPDTLDDCHTTDGDVYIDSHGRSQCCVSRTICALQDNGAQVGTDLDARPQGHRVGC